MNLIGNPYNNQELKIPDCFKCKISSDLLLDQPVINKSGNSYEKKYLEQHVKNKGKFDPRTGVKFT